MVNGIEGNNRFDCPSFLNQMTSHRLNIQLTSVLMSLELSNRKDWKKMFKKVLDDFQDSLYVDRTETQNVVLYVFKVSNFKPVISDCSEKVDYIRKRAYACFSNEIQQLFPEVNFPEDIIRIRLNDERLEIGIAINTEGIKENSHFNEALHKRLKQNSICGLFQNNAADDVKKNL